MKQHYEIFVCTQSLHKHCVQSAPGYHDTVHKVAMGQAVFPVLLFSSGSIIPPVPHTHFHLSSR